MDNRLNRTIALLLAVGAALVVLGLALLLQPQPVVPNLVVDGLNNNYPPAEPPDYPADPTLRRLIGGTLAFVGFMAALVGAVATGVRLALSDRTGGQA